jgi:hypothetical protein
VEVDHRHGLAAALWRTGSVSLRGWRYATAELRPMPGAIIIGTQRGGTTSLHRWLCSHPSTTPFRYKEVHYFDIDYAKGERWYRAHYPIRRPSRMAVEASPYMLFHPLAPMRAAGDLPPTTRLIALLRNPVQRAISQYWHVRRLGYEKEASLEAALALEEQRLAGETERVRRGEESASHRRLSYRSRGHYAEQLRRWFDAVGRERVLVIESEELWANPRSSAAVLDWLGLSRVDTALPTINDAPRAYAADAATIEELQKYFEPLNEDLFELLGRRLWRQ